MPNDSATNAAACPSSPQMATDTVCDLETLERLHGLASSPEDCYGDSGALRAASITRMQAAADLDEMIARSLPALIAEIRRYREALNFVALSTEANAKTVRKGGFYGHEMADAMERTAKMARLALNAPAPPGVDDGMGRAPCPLRPAPSEPLPPLHPGAGG